MGDIYFISKLDAYKNIRMTTDDYRTFIDMTKSYYKHREGGLCYDFNSYRPFLVKDVNNINGLFNLPPMNFDAYMIKSIFDETHDPIADSSGTNIVIEPTIKKTVFIDLSVNSIKDLIDIITKYPEDDEIECNIDLKSLHSIKSELNDINNMIGMESLKNSLLDQLLYFIQKLHLGKEHDFKHTILCGPPGTGKTELAHILGKMYSKIGVLDRGVFKKVCRSDLIAGYLGQTAIKTTKVIEDCLGGCLFIDEAYSLASPNDVDSYSKECVDTLCEAMSNHKDKLMVIVAGYEKELNETIFNVNRGLISRFIWKFNTDNYNGKELMLIFKKKATENDWNVVIDENTLTKWFEHRLSNFKHFGRDVELLFTYTKIFHGRRIYGKSSDLRKNINLDDLNGGMQVFLKNTSNETPPSFLHTIYV